MGKADEMFGKIGYKKDRFGCYIQYKDGDMEIIFDTDIYTIDVKNQYITMQVLQAINEKVKELGWLDDK